MRKIALNENGRPVGDSHHLAKLTNHEVELVLELVRDGMKYSLIAEKFEVSKSCIGHIVSGRRRCQIVQKTK